VNSSELDYELPEELIAQWPAETRTGSRLLHVPAEGPPVHRRFTDFPDLLREGDLLVVNETRVLPARLAARRRTGGAVEILLVRREDGSWRALLRPMRRLRPGEILQGEDGDYRVEIEAIEAGEAIVRFRDLPAERVIERHGIVPLPPYVRRDPVPLDRERYQTVFARVPGAVAAPTAGLHFDEATLANVRARGVEVAPLVLHVGPGTFRPLPDGPLSDHRLEDEAYEIPVPTWEAVTAARRRGGRVVAVGTTVVRALESAIPAASETPRTSPSERRSGSAAAPAAAPVAAPATAPALSGRTDLFIRPPHRFRSIDALLTNFHLPRSSLLCLVAAFVGRERILAAYREAVRARYRFYSYGDVTFLERRT
jgi:S-adenosylmethionine:tRNA ribosyltransferase-isomerase